MKQSSFLVIEDYFWKNHILQVHIIQTSAPEKTAELRLTRTNKENNPWTSSTFAICRKNKTRIKALSCLFICTAYPPKYAIYFSIENIKRFENSVWNAQSCYHKWWVNTQGGRYHTHLLVSRTYNYKSVCQPSHYRALLWGLKFQKYRWQ